MKHASILRPWFFSLALAVLPAGETAQAVTGPGGAGLGPDGCGGCEGEGGDPPPEPPEPSPEYRVEMFSGDDGDPCEFRSGPDSCARSRVCTVVVERQRVRMGNRTVYRTVRGKKWMCR